MKNKIKDLDKRIDKISKEMDTLLQTKINLMILKREIHFKGLRNDIEKGLTDE